MRPVPKKDNSVSELLFIETMMNNPVRVYLNHIEFHDVEGLPRSILFKKIDKVHLKPEEKLAQVDTKYGEKYSLRLPRDRGTFQSAINHAITYERYPLLHKKKEEPKSKNNKFLEERMNAMRPVFRPSKEEIFGKNEKF